MAKEDDCVDIERKRPGRPKGGRKADGGASPQRPKRPRLERNAGAAAGDGTTSRTRGR